MSGRRAAEAALAAEDAASEADWAFEDWECEQIEKAYASLGDDDPTEHYPVTSRSTPEYNRLLRRER